MAFGDWNEAVRTLAEMSDAEVNNLLRERARIASERKAQEAVKLSIAFRQHVKREALDVLVPEHGRTSCSDEKRINGFGAGGEGGLPRCNRCAFLDILEGRDTLPDNITVRLSLEQA